MTDQDLKEPKELVEWEIKALEVKAKADALQKQYRQANIDRALKLADYKWSSDDFLNSEQYYRGDYRYVITATGVSEIRQMYQAICQFMKQGQRPQDIRSNTVEYLDYFGSEGYRGQDHERLMMWADAICQFSKKLMLLPEHAIMQDWHLYEQLLEICKRICKTQKSIQPKQQQ